MNILEKDDYLLIEMPEHADPSMAAIPPSVRKDGMKFVLDAKQVIHLFSAGVGYILALHKEIAESKGTLCVVNVNEEVGRGLRSQKLDTLIPVYDSIVEFELEDGCPP